MAPKYRIVVEEWSTCFGEVRRTPAVQRRAGFFWWVTITHCESILQAVTYIRNVENKPAGRVIKTLWK